MIRAVIFDFNGVLVDDESVHFALFREVLAGQGVDLTEAMYQDRYLGFDDRECLTTALADHGKPHDADRVNDLIARKGVRYFEVAALGLRFFPRAAECVAAMADRYAIGINSGALRGEIYYSLDQLAIRQHVPVVVAAEDTERGKPDPLGYTLAWEGLRRLPGLGDLEPGECVVLEDSIAGLQSARGAGMRTVGVAQTYAEAELAEVADVVVPDLRNVTPEWIMRTFDRLAVGAAR